MKQPYDFPLSELENYQPTLSHPDDFDAFWQSSLQALGDVALDYRLEEMAYPCDRVSVFRCYFKGFNHAQIEGLLVIPTQDNQQQPPLPGVVSFHGYNWCQDSDIHETVNLALRGYVCLKMMCRGQHMNSVDNVASSFGHVAGWMTKGILNKDEYYYRAVYMDAVRAIEVLADLDCVDANKIAVMGSSQGGGLALASAALSPIPKQAIAEYPYLSHFERAIDIAPRGPYNELNHFFRRHSTQPEIEQTALLTLSYFDVMNLAPKITCPTWVGVGLVDDVTPPSTVFAAYNNLQCEKEISVYRYFGHEIIPAANLKKYQILYHM